MKLYISCFNQSQTTHKIVYSIITIMTCAVLLFLLYNFNQRYTIAADAGQTIADKATELSGSASSPSSAFSSAASSLGLEANNDCLRFVQTVIRASGVDNSFPIGEYSHGGGVDEWSTVNYMNGSSKWDKIDTTNESDLKAGDILVSAVNGTGNNHIFIYLGNNKVASANAISGAEHYGRIGNLSNEWCNELSGGGTPFKCVDNSFQVFRINSSSDSGSSAQKNLTTGSGSYKLSDEYAAMFSQNNITNWNPNECENDGSSANSTGMCGDTPQKKYWSYLRQFFDEVHTAAILGNMDNEGGYGPTRWEIGKVVDSDGGSFIMSWDSLYNCGDETTGGCSVGVGSVGITWYLSNYLHWLNTNHSDSLQYFKDSKYSLPGSDLLPLMGDSLYNQIAETELKYILEVDVPRALGESGLAEFKAITDIREAAKYWAENYERCNGCLVGDGMTTTKQSRMDDAEYEYESLKGFVCAGSASSADITLIGDSISMYASSELHSKFPNSFLNMVGTRHATQGGDCSGDMGGLDVLNAIVSGSGTLKQQDGKGGSCKDLSIDSSSLKNNVVWQLGTNPYGANKSNLETILTKIGSDRKLFLVTPYTPSDLSGGYITVSKMNEIADMYRDFANSHDNVYVVDWANSIKSNYSKYIVDDESPLYVHPNAEGRQLLADLIATAVESANGSSSEPSGSSDTSNSQKAVSISGNNITWIGDSYSVQADNKDLLSSSEKFSGVDIGPSPNNVSTSYIQGSKFVSSGSSSNPSCLSILQDIIDANNLRPYLVFACGTNGGWSDSDITEFENLLSGTSTKAVVVTSKIPTNGYEDSNARLKALADSNKNISLADWTTVYDASYFDDDPEKIHPITDPGYEKWVGVIYSALSAMSSDPCDLDPTTAGEKIAEVAISISMPEDKASEADKGKTTEKYDQLIAKWGLSYGTNCSKVAGLAIMESGVDPDFIQVDPNSSEFVAGADQNWRWAGELKEYLDSSPNWEKVTDKNYLAGDIFTNGSHVFVYIGDGKVAESGVGGWAARIRPFTEESHSGFPAYRIKSSDDNATTVSGNSNILNDTAIDLAWSLEEADKANTEAKSTYKNAMKETGLENEFAGNHEGKSCDQFVRTVVQYALKDTGYPGVTENQYDYIVNTKSSEYTEVPFESTKGGDIVFFSTEDPFNPNNIQHTAVVVENEDGKFLAEASLDDYYGKIVNFRTLNRTTKAFRKNNLSSTGSNNPLCDNICSTDNNTTTTTTIDSSGLTDEQAEKLANNYNNNTDNWDSKAGAGLFCSGSDCASKYSNCSLMSAFFVEMFTSVGTGQAWSGMYGGNVVNVLSGMGFETGSEPKAFSIFSCGPTDWGHTGVVVRVDGSSVTTVEAGYPNMIGQKANMSTCNSYSSTSYAYLNSKMDMQKLMDFIGK